MYLTQHVLNIKWKVTSDKDYFTLPVLHQSLVVRFKSGCGRPISHLCFPQPHNDAHLQPFGVVVPGSATSSELCSGISFWKFSLKDSSDL